MRPAKHRKRGHMDKRRAGRSIPWLLATTCLIGSNLVGAEVWANDDKAAQTKPVTGRYSFNISAKPVSQTLREIGDITGISIAVSEQHLFGINGRPVRDIDQRRVGLGRGRRASTLECFQRALICRDR